MTLLLLTGACGMVVGARGMPAPGRLGLMLLGLALACGGASALNHVLDRDIDRLMGPRTASRPVAAGRMPVPRALEFGLALSACSFVVLGSTVNVLTATLALVGNLFYVVVYTGYLKRRGPGNIVLGGAAGAVPPLVGFAAATGNLALPAAWLFLIVFLWTPPHFWSLSLLLRDHYAAAKVPMLPVVRGERCDVAADRRLHGRARRLHRRPVRGRLVRAGLPGCFRRARRSRSSPWRYGSGRPPTVAGPRSSSTRRCCTSRSSSWRPRSTRRSRGPGGPRSTAFHPGARRGHPTGAPARDRARGRRCGTTPAGSARNANVAFLPGASPVIGAGLAAPGNAGVIERDPLTTAQECRAPPRFSQSTTTRQPSGIVTSSSPRPYPSKLKPLLALPSPARSVR